MTTEPPNEVSGRAGSDPPGTLPAGMRVFAYLLLVYTLQAVGLALLLYWFEPELVEQLIASAQGEVAPEDVPPVSLGVMLGIQALLLPLVVVVTMLFLRHVDGGRSFAALGVQGPVTPWAPVSTGRVWGRLALIASATAAALLVAWLLVAGVLSDLTVGDWQLRPPAGVDQPGGSIGLGDFVFFLLGFLVVAWLEELIFRGYVFTTLRERHNWANAAGITAVIYGLTSAGNPGIMPVALINAFLIGLVLAMVRELTGSIWVGAIGHGCWNFLIACVISLPFGGQEAPSMLEVRAEGTALVTGGDFGPEASVVLSVLLLPIAVGIAYLLGRLFDLEEETDAPEDDG